MRTASAYRWISITFLILIAVGTLALMLPFARTGVVGPADTASTFGPRIGGGAPFSVALFTAASASCVTGLIVVDTPEYWSTFGQVVILILLEVGGLGTMTFAAFLARVVRYRLSVRVRQDAAVALSAPGLGDLNRILTLTVVIAALTQGTAAAVLTVRLMIGRGYGLGQALWYGLFHAASAYNNAGFALYTDSLVSFQRDPWVILTIAALIIVGGIGFPVIIELMRGRGLTSLHSRIVVTTTVCLLLGGTVFMAVAEWANARTLGPLGPADKVVNAFFAAVTPRTAGFNSIDVSQMHASSWFGTDILMIVGAAPASTGGGLKVTALAVIALITWGEIRGMNRVHVGRWRLGEHAQSQVVTLLGLAGTLVVGATMVLMATTPFTLDRCLFETISAFATVGMTTGITAQLPGLAQVIIIVLMVIGRIGPATLAAALTMRHRPLLIDRPAGSLLIG